MELMERLLCLLVISVCGGDGQILSTTVNVDTSQPASNDNRRTDQPLASFNLYLIQGTSVQSVSQTSGLRANSPFISTQSDYRGQRSNYFTSDYTSSSSENYNLITSTSDQVETWQTRTPALSSEGMTVSNSVPISSSRYSSLTSNNLTGVPFPTVAPLAYEVFPTSSHVSSSVLLSTRHRVGDVHETDIQASSSLTEMLNIYQTTSVLSSSYPVRMLQSVQIPQETFAEGDSVQVVTSSNVHSSADILSVQLSSVPLSSSSRQISVHPDQITKSSVLLQGSSLFPESSSWTQYMAQETSSHIAASSHVPLSSQDIPVPVSSSVSSTSRVVPSIASVSSHGVVSVASSNIQVGSSRVEVVAPSSAIIIESTSGRSLSESSFIVEESTNLPVDSSVSSVLSASVGQTETEAIVPSVSSSASSLPESSKASAMSSLTLSSSQGSAVSNLTSSPSQVSVTSTATSSLPPSIEVSRTPEVPTSTSSVHIEASGQTSHVTSSTAGPSPASSSNQTSSSSSGTVSVSTTPIHTTSANTVIKDCFFKLTFEVECSLIFNNSLIMAEFVGSLQNVLVMNLKIKQEQVKLYDPACGSFIIYVGLTKVRYNVVKNSLFAQFQQKKFEVPIMVDNQWLRILGVKVVETGPPSTSTPINFPDGSLDKVDMIVIIIACSICGILITIGIILCAKECYRRKYAQSFDLLEVPHVNLKLEDFTLTRIPRPKTVYNEEAVTMQAFMDSSQRIVKASDHHSTNGNSVQANDVHVRMKQNKDGLVVGVTGYSSHRNGISDKSNKRKSSAGSSEASHGRDPASENLLQKGNSSHTQVGAHNPIFVDDENAPPPPDPDQNNDEH